MGQVILNLSPFIKTSNRSKMQKTGTQITKKQKSLQRKQTTLSNTALSDETAVYARVTKHLGNRSFLITIFDEKNNRHVTDVKARVLSKRMPRIVVPSVVNVALAEGRDPEDSNAEFKWGTKNWEIIIPIDEKTVRQLKKDGHISEVLASSSEISAENIKNVDEMLKKGLGSNMIDYGFEFERGEEEETDVTTANTVKKDKASKHTERVLRSENDEVDIDAI
jgi:SAM-dependent MidA family methyltransferase